MPRLPLILSVLVTVSGGSSTAQTSAVLVGTWQLVSRVDRDRDGRVLSEISLGSLEPGGEADTGRTRTIVWQRISR